MKNRLTMAKTIIALELQYEHRWTRLRLIEIVIRLCVGLNRSADIGQVSLEVQLGTESIEGSDW